MAINTKPRTELKQYFVKNAIPTQGNFADLIDAQLNQSDDGVFKLPDQPLGVVAVVGEQRRALQLYSAYPAPNPDWMISLNPKLVAPGVGNQAGFGVADGAGTTRLLLDPSGNLGVSGSVTATTDVNYGGLLSKLDVKEQSAATVRAYDFNLGHSTRRGQPGRALVDNQDKLVLNFAADWSRTEIQSPLTVNGAVEVNVPGAVNATWGRFAVTTTNSWGDGGNQYVTLGAGGASGIMFNNPHVVWIPGESRASMRFGRSDGVVNGAYWDVGTRTGDAFSIAYNGPNDHKLYMAADGSVGIGTTTPSTKLAVANGDLSIEGGYYRRLRVVSDQYWAGIELVCREQGTPGNPHIDFTHGDIDSPNYGVRMRSPGNNSLKIEAGVGEVALTVAGPLYAGGSDIYFTQTDHTHTGIGNTNGYAAIENASDYGALMIMGRRTNDGRIVKLFDYLEVNGTLRVTGSTLQIGDWTLEVSGNSLLFKRGVQTVARFSTDHDRFLVYRNVNGTAPYFYYNSSGIYSVHNG